LLRSNAASPGLPTVRYTEVPQQDSLGGFETQPPDSRRKHFNLDMGRRSRRFWHCLREWQPMGLRQSPELWAIAIGVSFGNRLPALHLVLKHPNSSRRSCILFYPWLTCCCLGHSLKALTSQLNPFFCLVEAPFLLLFSIGPLFHTTYARKIAIEVQGSAFGEQADDCAENSARSLCVGKGFNIAWGLLFVRNSWPQRLCLKNAASVVLGRITLPHSRLLHPKLGLLWKHVPHR
jgi:hypothetical protein